MVLKGRWPAARARPVRPLILSRPCYSCLLGYLALLAPSLTLYFLTKILCLWILTWWLKLFPHPVTSLPQLPTRLLGPCLPPLCLCLPPACSCMNLQPGFLKLQNNQCVFSCSWLTDTIPSNVLAATALPRFPCLPLVQKISHLCRLSLNIHMMTNIAPCPCHSCASQPPCLPSCTIVWGNPLSYGTAPHPLTNSSCKDYCSISCLVVSVL